MPTRELKKRIRNIPDFPRKGIRFFRSLVGMCTPSSIQIRGGVHGLPVDAQFEV